METEEKLDTQVEIVTNPKEGATMVTEKVACFLDIPNMETSAYQKKILFDPGVIRGIAESFGRILYAKAYGFVSKTKPISNGVMAATFVGFEFVPRVMFEEGRKDIDTCMTTDIVEMACRKDVNVIVVVSGDSDFIPAIRIARRRGKKVIAIAFEECCSHALVSEVDQLIVLRRSEQPNAPSEASFFTANNVIA